MSLPSITSTALPWLFGFAFGVSSVLGSCDLPDDALFRSAPPAPNWVTVPFPGVSTNSPRMPKSTEKLRDATAAEYFGVAQDMAVLSNVYVLSVLNVARVMVQLPATSRIDPTLVFGPYEPGSGDPLTYRLVVTQTAPTSFTYLLSGRSRQTTGGTDFLPLLEGSMQKDPEALGPVGRLAIFFDNRRKLDDKTCEQGRLDVEYDGHRDPAQVSFSLKQVGTQNPAVSACHQDPPRDGWFHATHFPDDSGSFLFDVRRNVHAKDPAREALETVLLLARWDKDGQGRADGKIADGEVSIDLRNAGLPDRYLTFSECWDIAKKSVYLQSTPAALRLWPPTGDPSRCVPANAEFPE
ncbi:MAG TPA: hypothetical protein PKE31_15970 [Pseudomonadota bacterium]|mgnify:CR=1 FL=1|jgi:hypothetical protein|nr:hypothetical protein [Pseudomonadota bacterium]